ncbi:hypothetical protein BGY98DRAFT_938464 [Russula aff. rugulosa BPL654]|nr:hypothetical protein BGY98DRAFT_938464 [Russula aff. rugulosa BPL654]
MTSTTTTTSNSGSESASGASPVGAGMQLLLRAFEVLECTRVFKRSWHSDAEAGTCRSSTLQQSDATPPLSLRTPRSQPSFLTAQLPISNSQNEDAERDCTTVLGLLNKNVKALFRRAQARTALQKLSEAHNDLQKALKLEPNNETVAELARVDELIVNRKEKLQRSVPIDIAASSPPPAPPSSSTAPPKRRVPITIVDKDHPPIITQPTGDNNDILLNPISSRRVSQTPSTPAPAPPPPDANSTPMPPAPAVPSPAPASFREAKQYQQRPVCSSSLHAHGTAYLPQTPTRVGLY